MALAGGPADEGQAAFGAAVAEHAAAALAAGVDPTSPEAAEVVDRVLASSGGPATDRTALADQLARFTDARVERYWALLATINGWPAWSPQVPVYEWFIAALRA